MPLHTVYVQIEQLHGLPFTALTAGVTRIVFFVVTLKTTTMLFGCVPLFSPTEDPYQAPSTKLNAHVVQSMTWCFLLEHPERCENHSQFSLNVSERLVFPKEFECLRTSMIANLPQVCIYTNVMLHTQQTRADEDVTSYRIVFVTHSTSK